MSAASVARAEFDLWVKISSESSATTATAIKQLTEYTIHNDHNQQENNKRFINLAEEQQKLKKAVAENTKVNSFWITIKKYLIYVLIGGLTVFGGIIANEYLAPVAPSTEIISND